MRINLADVLAILTILAICVGTAMVIGHFQPEKPVRIFGIILGILIGLLGPLSDGGSAKETLRRAVNPEYRHGAWPVGTYLIAGLVTLLVALMAIALNVFIEVFLGGPCGYAIGATLARHNRAASIVQAEGTTDHTDGHG